MSNNRSQGKGKKSTAAPLIAGGVFLVVVILMVYLMMAGPSHKTSKKIVSKQYETKPFQDIKKDESTIRKTDVLEKRLEDMQKELDANQDQIDKLREDSRMAFSEMNKNFTRMLNDTRNSLNQATARLNEIERMKSGVKEVRVVKPSRSVISGTPVPSRKRSDQQRHRVQAVVNDRAWISADDDAEQSIVVGDQIDEPRRKEVVEQIDAQEGTIITSSH
mgnify:FL=1